MHNFLLTNFNTQVLVITRFCPLNLAIASALKPFYFCRMLPDIIRPQLDDLLLHVGITKEQFAQMDYEEIARAFMSNGFHTDTRLKDTHTALGLYWIGMQSAMKAGLPPHHWATLFERVVIILRKHKRYDVEIKVLREIIPRFPYLAKYHKWAQRLARLEKRVLKSMDKQVKRKRLNRSKN